MHPPNAPLRSVPFRSAQRSGACHDDNAGKRMTLRLNVGSESPEMAVTATKPMTSQSTLLCNGLGVALPRTLTEYIPDDTRVTFDLQLRSPTKSKNMYSYVTLPHISTLPCFAYNYRRC